MDATINPAWLEPTWFIDSDSTEVGDFVTQALSSIDAGSTQTDKAVALFHAVRDGFR